MKQNTIIVILAILLSGSIGYGIGKNNNKPNPSAYFTTDSDKFLNGIKLDLPEEISTIKQQSDSTLDLLTGYLDTDDGVIYLGFSGKEMNKYDHLFITEHSQLLPDIHEYQLDLEMDSVFLFDHGRFVGKAKYGNSQLDSLFMSDNQ